MKNTKGSYRVEGLMKINDSLAQDASDEVVEALEDITLVEDVGHPDFHDDPYFDLHTDSGPF